MHSKTLTLPEAFVSLWLATSTLAGPTLAETPLPTASGPLAVTAESYPFGATDHTLVKQDLSADGYVEEEYFLSGQANVYDWPKDSNATVRTKSAPYTTRVLVRRPAERSKFSGTVVVELLNPSNLFDLNIGWGLSGGEMMRNGDAWVGVTSKPISVVALQRFHSKRYSGLSWANPLEASDERNCSKLSADSSQETENGLVWDIFTQTGAWLRSDRPDNPLTYGSVATDSQPIDDPIDHPVDVLYGWGYSQTGSFLYTYINAVQPTVIETDGRPMYDGYIVGVAGGPMPIHQCAERTSREDPRSQFRNAGTPILRVMTQSDYLYTINARRPDSDDPNDRFRNYEIAGSGHASPHELYSAAAPADIEKAGLKVPPMSCNEGPRSRFPSGLTFDAALRSLDLWVRKNVPPPRAEPIQVKDKQPLLDEFGNVLGGVRSPYVDVPTSTWFGNSTGPSFCRIAGHEIPFEQQRLTALYPTHDVYVNAVKESVETLVGQRFLTRTGGDWLVEQARAAQIP